MSNSRVKLSVEECDDLIGIVRGVSRDLSPESKALMQKLLNALITAEGIDLPSDEEILKHNFNCEEL